MAKITITNPPPFIPTRRKSGWGSAITYCHNCGSMMVGHHRGYCSSCAICLGIGQRPTHQRVIHSSAIGAKAFARDLKSMARTVALSRIETQKGGRE